MERDDERSDDDVHERKTMMTGLSIEIDERRIEWQPTGIDGIELSPLHPESVARGEPAQATVLIRMSPGVGYPRHRHLDVEEVLVLRGGYRDELGEYRCGDYVRYEAGSVHSATALGDAGLPETPENPACVLFASARGGIEILGSG